MYNLKHVNLKKFWNSVRELLDLVDANDMVVLFLFLSFDAVLGPYGDSLVNDAGKHIVNLWLEKNLLLTNTFFPYKDIHLYKCRSNDQTRPNSSNGHTCLLRCHSGNGPLFGLLIYGSV